MKTTSIIIMSFGALAAATGNSKEIVGGYGSDDYSPDVAPVAPKASVAPVAPVISAAPVPIISAPASDDKKPIAGKTNDDDCETSAAYIGASPTLPAKVDQTTAKNAGNTDVLPVVRPTGVVSAPAVISSPPSVLIKPTLVAQLTSLVTEVKPTTLDKVPAVAKPTQSAYLAAPAPAGNATIPKVVPVTAGTVTLTQGVGAVTFVAAGIMAALLF